MQFTRKKMGRFNHGTLGLGFILLAASAHAESFEYPELSVVPRASERIRIEGDKEMNSSWAPYLPIQASALTTLVAGGMSLGGDAAVSPKVAMAVGAGWLGLTSYFALSYRPYSLAYSRISPMAKGTVREQLTRERFAEEEIRRLAVIGRKLQWLSVLTNLGASVFMLGQQAGNTASVSGSPATATAAAVAPVDAVKNSTAQGAQIASAVMSFVPLLFPFYWNDVADAQVDYRKKIYGPVASGTVFFDRGTGTTVPGMALTFQF